MSNPNLSYNIIPATSVIHLQSLVAVLESAIRDSETGQTARKDVEYVYDRIIHPSKEGGCYTTLVAWSEHEAKALGVMSLTEAGTIMRGFTTTDNPAELTNAYVLEEARGSGVGRSLVEAIENKARKQGSTELVLNSDPRFEKTGWPFWRRVYGEPAGIAADYYGEGYDAPVWRKQLLP